MKIFVLCNGQPPDPRLFSQVYSWADYFIAADGGGNVARTFNSLPDLEAGDLDSFVSVTHPITSSDRMSGKGYLLSVEQTISNKYL